MSFDARLSTDQVPVDPGVATPLVIVVDNRSDDAHQFEIQVEGIDLEWVAVPVPLFRVGAQESHTEKVFIKPPRISESVAGNYPFVLKIRSLDSGDTRAMQGVVTVKPFHHISMELSPKRGRVSSVAKSCRFTLTLMNLGNTDHTVQLMGSDPENQCAFEFEREGVTLTAGQQTTIAVGVSATSSRFLANPRLHGFTISGRSREASAVACSAQGQLEQRAMVSPGSAVFALVLALLVVGWWMIFPKPPKVESLILSSKALVEGEKLTVSWRASQADKVELYLNDRLFFAGKASDQYEMTPTEGGIIKAVAYRDGKRSPEVSEAFTVNPKERADPPRIESFAISPKDALEGDTLLVSYRVGPSVKRLNLEPVGEELSVAANEREIVANRIGDIKYVLIAENADGVQTKQEFSVKVRARPVPPLAKILKFEAEPMVVDPALGRVTLRWEVEGAEKVELDTGAGTELVAKTGEREVTGIGQETKFRLVVTDANGVVVDRVLTVAVGSPDSPPPSAASGPSRPDTRPAMDVSGVGGRR
ncbi:MAG: hypothetical protein KIS66_10355 [Fimbriimonadaceae bacterium]|nr:hypothetical protein [Fimbriimonadaceae bacterium]